MGLTTRSSSLRFESTCKNLSKGQLNETLTIVLSCSVCFFTGALKKLKEKRRCAAGYLLIHYLLNCFTLAIAEVYKNEGNDSYRENDFNDAIYFYTEGIKVNCKDEELKAKLYSNRANAYFCLGEKFLLTSIGLSKYERVLQ